MLSSLKAILRYEAGDFQVLRQERWLMHLALTQENTVNLERVASMGDRKRSYTLEYVKRSLEILDRLPGREGNKHMAEEALKWSEVAKAGLPAQRERWKNAGHNLAVHNEGAAQIYLVEAGEPEANSRRIIHTLIATHGLLGQYLRGEVLLTESFALHGLLQDGLLQEADLQEILYIQNRCIVGAVSEALWHGVETELTEAISVVVKGDFTRQFGVRERLRRLRSVSAANGEDFGSEFSAVLSNGRARAHIECLLSTAQLWYVEAALYDFSFEQFIKILLLASSKLCGSPVRHLSFAPLMEQLYYEHKGRKRVNIYKKRIIENCLSTLTMEDILNGRTAENSHTQQEIALNELANTAFFSFRFSGAGAALIDFCVEAEKSGVMYEKAVVLLFDLFGLRRDAYDRFNEEERYLATMNSTVNYKSVILNFIKGARVLDIGPGGGALMNLIEERRPECRVTGVDISQNVIEELRKKKQIESRHWDVIEGDALNLVNHIRPGEADTVIFCSILHELFSYIPFNGRKFNHETIATALLSAFKVLSPGGRIIIRDGIMTEPEDMRRVIRFRSQEGMEYLRRYAEDFQGRPIRYETVGRNEVVMPVNDAMEFLYTYTWGEESYVHEVQEQFGYFSPSGYQQFIRNTLGPAASIIENRHYLQEGYSIALSQKVEFLDESGNTVPLPDSTCLIVLEKNCKEGSSCSASGT